MKQILFLTIIIGLSIAATAQNNKYYLYGSKFVHNEYLRLDSSEKKIYYKGENNKMEREVKIINGNYIVPGKGKCIITGNVAKLNIVTSEGNEYWYQPLQVGDKPGKQHLRKTK